MTPNWLGFLKGSKDEAEARHRKKVVYSLDDDGRIREMIKEILEPAGYHVELFWSGPELMEALDEEVPDVILLDINMPVVSGWDVRKQLARRHADQQIPVIAVTGTKAENAERYAREGLGFTDFLRKPFDADTLVEAVGKAVEGRPTPRQPSTTSSPSEASKAAQDEDQAEQAEPTTPATATTDPDDEAEIESAEIEEITPEPVEAPTGPRVYVGAGDDNVRGVVVRALEKRGYAVTGYADGDALVERLSDDPPGLLLLDLLMSGPNGEPLARRLARDPQMGDVPVIGIQRIQSEPAARLIRWVLGLDACLVAPFDGGDAAEQVGIVLQRRQAAESSQASSQGPGEAQA